jgi:hypothetical protein
MPELLMSTEPNTILLGQHYGQMTLVVRKRDPVFSQMFTGGSFALTDGLNRSSAIPLTNGVTPTAAVVEAAIRAMHSAYADVTVGLVGTTELATYTITLPGTNRSALRIFDVIGDYQLAAAVVITAAFPPISITGDATPIYWRVQVPPDIASVAPLAPKVSQAAAGVNDRGDQPRASQLIAGNFEGGIGKFRLSETEGVNRYYDGNVPTFTGLRVPARLNAWTNVYYVAGAAQPVACTGAMELFRGACYQLATVQFGVNFAIRLFKSTDVGLRNDASKARFDDHATVIAPLTPAEMADTYITDTMIFRRRLFYAAHRYGTGAIAGSTDGTTAAAFGHPANRVSILFAKHDRKLYALMMDTLNPTTYYLHYTDVSNPVGAADWVSVGSATSEIDVSDGIPRSLMVASGPNGDAAIYLLTTKELIMIDPTNGYTTTVTTCFSRLGKTLGTSLNSSRGLSVFNRDLYFIVGPKQIGRLSGAQVSLIGPDPSSGWPGDGLPVPVSQSVAQYQLDSGFTVDTIITSLRALSSMMVIGTLPGVPLVYVNGAFHTSGMDIVSSNSVNDALYLPLDGQVGGWMVAGTKVYTWNDATGDSFDIPHIAYATTGALTLSYYDRNLAEIHKAFLKAEIGAEQLTPNERLRAAYQMDDRHSPSSVAAVTDYTTDAWAIGSRMVDAAGNRLSISLESIGSPAGTIIGYFGRKPLHDGRLYSHGVVGLSLRMRIGWESANSITASATALSTTVTTTADYFMLADVGRWVIIGNAGTAGQPLCVKITGVNNPRSITIATAAITTSSPASIRVLRSAYLRFVSVVNEATFDPLASFPVVIDTTLAINDRDSIRQETDLNWIYKQHQLTPYADDQIEPKMVRMDYFRRKGGRTGQTGGAVARRLWSLTLSERTTDLIQ